MSDYGFERCNPLRFAWQMDDQGLFTLGSAEFVKLMGDRTAAVMGKPWAEVAEKLLLDPEGQIARAVATRETWSGLIASWPMGDGGTRVAVELSGLPVFDRERIFRGYRGFGICRDTASLAASDRAREAPTDLVAEPAQSSTAQPEDTPTSAAFSRKIVPFPAAPPESAAPSLTAVERLAFRELSRKLAEGLAGTDAKARGGNTPDPVSGDEVVSGEAAPSETAFNAQAVLDRISLGVLVYRFDQLLYANPFFLKCCGHHSLDSLIAAGGLDALLIEPIGPAATGCNQSLTLRMERGSNIALRGELITFDGDVEPTHALLISPKENQAEHELIDAKRRAEAASSAKSDLVAKISHEMRTPLNSVIGFAELMLQERFGPIANERYREYIGDIHACGGHLLSLINDLLDLSKIEAGKLELTFAELALNELVQQCVAIMQPHARRDRIIIRTTFASALPQIVADARSVRQITLNLLSNALKFTPAGGQVIVSTSVNHAGEIVLRVRDTGKGMTKTEITSAFEPFRQLGNSPRGGTGLGLPLTKAMTEANRAKLNLTSTPNEGTLVEIAFAASSGQPA
jgi:signal transduction histidine kinase